MHWKGCYVPFINKHIAATNKYIFSESETLYKLEKALLDAEILSIEPICMERADLKFVPKKEQDSFGACFLNL